MYAGNPKMHPNRASWSGEKVKILKKNFLSAASQRPHKEFCILKHIEAKTRWPHENVWISLKIPLKFVRKGPINNIPALVQIMSWHRPGDKQFSEPMLVFVPTHICVTRPQWVKDKTVSARLLCVLTTNQRVLDLPNFRPYFIQRQ